MIIILKGIAGYLDFAFARLFNAPYAILFILSYICLRKLMKEKNVIQSFLTGTGRYSLELYIIHVALRDIMGTLGLPIATPFVYGICIIITILIAIGYAGIHRKIFTCTN